MEVKTITSENGDLLQVVNKKTLSYKPLKNEKGQWRYSDVLVYLCRVLPQNEPSLQILFGLASFALNNSLSDKQKQLARKFITYWEEKGVI